jgi:heat shock protein HslJ
MKNSIAGKLFIRKSFAALCGCGAAALLVSGVLVGSTPVAQAAEKPVPLTATIHFDAARKTLAWTEWELVSPGFEGAEKTPFLNFTDEGIGAGVGLNVIGGDYSTAGSKISIGNLISTQMAGPPELMKAERRFIKALNEAQSFVLSNDGETLILRGGESLTFRLKARTPHGFIPHETRIVNVAPQLGPQMDGDKTPRYLHLQLEDMSHDISWGRFTEEEIIGFDFVPGYRYQLRVLVERNPRTNQQRLRLVEVFSQQWMEPSALQANEKILEVAPTKVDCSGVGKMRCLQVREVGGEWRALSAPIIGFDFQEGWRYRLQVAVTKIENPPADASDVRYTVVRLLDKMPVTY